VFMSTFMYMKKNIVPHNVDWYLERTRTVSAVKKQRGSSRRASLARRPAAPSSSTSAPSAWGC